MLSTKVCMLAPVHIWDDVRVFKKQAITLSENGYSVLLIARTEKELNINGVQVIPADSCHKTRLLRFFSLPAVAIQVLKIKADIYHLHNPDTIPIVLILRLFGKKVIYDTHEDFTKRILIRNWVPKPFRRFLAYMIGISEQVASKFTNANIATQNNVVYRLGSKTILLGNLPRTNSRLIEKVVNISMKIKKDHDIFRLIYIGGIDENRGLFEMIDAIELINKKIKCRLWLIGHASLDKIEMAQHKPGWIYVDYLPRMAQEQAFAYVVKSDIGLIYIRDVGDHAQSDPNKIYEYMTFGKPFIASNFNEWVDKLDIYQAGIFIQPGKYDILARTVLAMQSDAKKLKKMGENGRKYVEENNWEKESIKLLNLYKKLMLF